MRSIFLIVCLFAATLPANISWATNGYFQHGVGVKEQSVGGAATAFPQSVMSAATNPATLIAVGRRLDLGIDWFNPRRSVDRDGSGYSSSNDKSFFIPQLGYSHPLGKSIAVAMILYANGGMQTNWPQAFFGSKPTSSCLQQMVIAPTVSYQLAEKHSIGLALNYIRQSFKATGLDAFAGFTPSGTTEFLTDRGKDESSGWGVKFGYFGELTDRISIGAFWQPRTSMEKLSLYRELLPEQGGMDIPETYGIGLAIKLSEKLTLATDLTTIKYSDIPTLGNRNTGGALLGTNEGPGFGWRDVNTLKIGISYRYTPQISLRAGWNHGNNPIRSSETTLNILSPATTTDHLTVGGSWKVRKHTEISLTYWHAFNSESTGDSASDPRLKMEQNDIGFSCSWLF